MPIPQDIAERLPKSALVKVTVVPMVDSSDQARDAEWRAGAYEQFMRDDSPEDAIYDDY